NAAMEGHVPVRDSSEWKHAMHMKKVINLDQGGDGRVTESGTHYVMCAWDTCENDGLENFKVRVNDAAPGYEPKYINYVFCTERHKYYWLASMRSGNNNNLPAGRKRSIL